MSTTVKRRAVRKFPPFYVYKSKDGKQERIDGCHGTIQVAEPFHRNLPSICPYTNYIPLSYLPFYKLSYGMPPPISEIERRIVSYPQIRSEGISSRYNHLPLIAQHILYGGLLRRDPSVHTFMEDVDKWLTFDKVVTLGENSSAGSIDALVQAFSTPYLSVHYLNTQSFYSWMGWMIAGVSHNLQAMPAVVGCIPKENYLYVKLKYFLTGEIDVTKCVFFVDRRLDTTSYPYDNFRLKVYRNGILPYIESLSTTIAKVPVEYIEKECFLTSYEPKASNIAEIKKEKEWIVDVFKKYVEDEKSIPTSLLSHLFEKQGEGIAKAIISGE